MPAGYSLQARKFITPSKRLATFFEPASFSQHYGLTRLWGAVRMPAMTPVSRKHDRAFDRYYFTGPPFGGSVSGA